jgi:uncharacterized protein involved in outer membrane biogenesis
MKAPVRWFLRIIAVLFIAVLAAIIAGILLLDSVVRGVVVRRLQAATGMGVKITAVHVGLLKPTMSIEGLKLYNTPEYGGALCLDMPELRLDYDPAALRAGTFHFSLVRLNLAQIGVVEDKKGRNNFDAIQKDNKLAGDTNSTNGNAVAGKERNAPISQTNSLNGFAFTGIDTLVLSLGKFNYSKLGSSDKEEVDFNITNQVLHNVKSQADITGIAALLALRGAASSGNSSVDLNSLLKDLVGH